MSSPTHATVHRHTDLAPHILREIEHFFAIYKELEGKRTEVRGWGDVTQAQTVIRQSHGRFKQGAPH